MLRPSHKELIKKINEFEENSKIESKYSLVIAVSKRARRLIEIEKSGVVILKPITRAIEDICDHKVVIVKE